MGDFSTLVDLVEKVSSIAGTSMEYKSTREVLESTTKDLGPLVEEIGQYVKENDIDSEEIEKLKKIVEANQEVLKKYKINGLNFLLAPYFQRKLDEEYQTLQRYCSVQMQTQIARDLKRVLSMLSADEDGDDYESSLRSRSFSHRGAKRIRRQTFKGSFENFPEFTVGLDGPFMKDLKTRLLHGDEQVLNLHGLAGSGKTTIARKLCHDLQVKGNPPYLPLFM